jgi:hypothetical protein
MSHMPLSALRLPPRAIGWVVATAIGTAFAFPIFFFPPSGDGVLQVLSISGVFIGTSILQWYVLRLYGTHRITWRALPAFIGVSVAAVLGLMVATTLLGNNDAFLVVWFAYLGAVLGAAIGALRWFLSLRGLHVTPWWILLDTGAWAIAFALGRIAPEATGIVSGWKAGPVLGGLASPEQAYDLFFPVIGATSGAVVGSIEWLAFRKQRLCSFPSWMASNVAGWAAGWMVARLGVGPALGLRGGLVAGAIAGAITGLALTSGFRSAATQAEDLVKSDSKHPHIPTNGA